MTSAKYRIYVRLKNGDQVGGRELYKGAPPAPARRARVADSANVSRTGIDFALVSSSRIVPALKG